MTLRDGAEDFLNVAEGEKIFKVVNKNQHQHVVLAVLLLLRRREKVVLGVIVNHGFSQNFIFLMPFYIL